MFKMIIKHEQMPLMEASITTCCRILNRSNMQ